MAAPTQRGAVARKTFTAPTSTIFKIRASSFKRKPTSKNSSEENESGEEDLEVFWNPGHTVSFIGTLRADQAPRKIGDVIELTYPAGHPLAGARKYVVTSADEDGYAEVIRQAIEAKYNDAADYGEATA